MPQRDGELRSLDLLGGEGPRVCTVLPPGGGVLGTGRRMTLETLTILSTSCIVLSGLSLLLGWYFIRGRSDRIRHRNTMLTATVFAALFLVFYVTRWSL